MLKKITLAAALAASPVVTAPAVFAQDEEQQDNSGAGDMMKELGIFEKLMDAFDTSDAEPIDEKQLKLARVTSAAIIPDGTYGRMMQKTFDQMLAPMAELFSAITPTEISIATGVDEETIAQLSAEQMESAAEILDPAREERGKKVFDLMIPLMKDAFTEIEPALREGMARAYARKFTGKQLKELNTFFKTPTGAKYASESFVIMADPEIIAASMQAMPAVMEKVFAVMPQMEEEMKNAPKSKMLVDLSEDEMDALAKTLGVPKEQLKKNEEELFQDAIGDDAGDETDTAGAEEQAATGQIAA